MRASTSSSATVIGKSGGPGRKDEAHHLPSHDGKPPCRCADSLSSGRNTFAGLNGFPDEDPTAVGTGCGGMYE